MSQQEDIELIKNALIHPYIEEEHQNNINEAFNRLIERTLPELPEGWKIFDLNDSDCGYLNDWHCVLIKEDGLDEDGMTNYVKVENDGDKTLRTAAFVAIEQIKE